ncbi:unnamed protein product [Gongylonema pulchrum]|uniref:G protein-coupled receptor n=1 Tax=Gongylonema pulchrum TaxID=637853 RepID=A0A183ECJ2_9BILA|nr:unnamed protein product [Gongylonema pulchrum]
MGYLIPWNINTMSVFSLTLKLFEDGGYTHPGYQDELYEWARQARRWPIGAAEVFHYFDIKFTSLPAAVSIIWALRYFSFILIMAEFTSIVAPVAVSVKLRLVQLNFENILNLLSMYITLGFLGLQYLWFFVVFAVNPLAEPVFPCRSEYILLYSGMAYDDWLLYCEVFAFLEVTVCGKTICSRSASKKDALVQKVTSINPTNYA